ncbi:MAG TPA: exodeoxyribonuclease VII large subunit, partial [Thermoanaerobaculia bacterium]|nr:exodeoxyribonuclease VII large subunit [Thermoanaerobaculia bacterium]
MSARLVPAPAPPRPYTVSELLAEVGTALRTSWRDISVAGEIGRFEVRSGHGYFTLKDRTGTLAAIIFSSDFQRVPFRVEPGLAVVARGSLDLYAPQGKFQLKAYALEPVGVGALQLAFEQLKAKLGAEGLFDPARKRRIPLLPRRIGIVTSPVGAAIRDILNILERRFEGLAVTIYPVRVQGQGAPAEIVEGLRALNLRGGFDVLIVARGGGSPEDLAPFNDERVARAVAESRIPVISGIGHETDITIADLVADLRAPTPSAAAELVVEKKAELARQIGQGRRVLHRMIGRRLELTRARLSALSRAEGLLRFRYRLREWRERVAQSGNALLGALARRPARDAARLLRARGQLLAFPRVAEYSRKRESVTRLRVLLQERLAHRLEQRRERARVSAEKLALVSPLAVLARGYAVALREGSPVPLLSVSGVRAGDRIRVRLHEGELKAVVRETIPSPGTPA